MVPPPSCRSRHSPELAEQYAHCLRLASNHYENFPVVSRLLPNDVRPCVAAIYAFARGADDLADEGNDDANTRLARLTAYGSRLESIGTSIPSQDPVFGALADTIARHRLPLQPFRDLLSAFRMDTAKRRYADLGELQEYCRRSAAPVGRLLLHLLGEASAPNIALSDKVCTGLQLTNMLQDLGQDYEENGRIYLPQDEMTACGVSERHFRERVNDQAMRRLMEIQLRRGESLLRHGLPLARRLPGRTALYMRLVVHGGLRVLERIRAHPQDPFGRPRLRRRDWLLIVARALRLSRG